MGHPPVSGDIYITPDGLTGIGASELAGTIVHELLHKNNHGGGSDSDADEAIKQCGVLPTFFIKGN